MRSSVHEDLLPFCEFKLDHLQNDSEMIACAHNYRELFKYEVFPIIVSSTPLEQRVWKIVDDDPNWFVATKKKLSEDLDDDDMPRIGSVWEELEQEGVSKKRKRDEVYTSVKRFLSMRIGTVTLVPCYFTSEQGRSNQLYVTFYITQNIMEHCTTELKHTIKSQDEALEMETENIKTSVVDKKKQRWTRRKEKEEFYCVNKQDRNSTQKHKL